MESSNIKLSTKRKRQSLKRGINCAWSVEDVIIIFYVKDKFLSKAVKLFKGKNWKKICEIVPVK